MTGGADPRRPAGCWRLLLADELLPPMVGSWRLLLLEGARPLIEDTEGMTRMEIVVREIMEDKITIDFGASDINEPTETKG